MAYSAQPAGTLAKLISRIRLYSNEPVADALYTPETLYPLITASYDKVMRELNTIGDHPVVVRFSITLVVGTEFYYLPANVGQILRYAYRDTDSGHLTDWMVPRSRLNPAGPGVAFEGNMLRVNPWPTFGDTIVVEYIPTGECSICVGTVDQDAFDTDTLVISTSPSEGYWDARPNAYLGCMLNIYSADVVPTGYIAFPPQERPISAYNVATATVTVPVDFDVDFSIEDGNYTYEIVPLILRYLIDAVAWDVAALIAGMNKDYQHTGFCEKQFARAVRAGRLEMAKGEARNPSLIHNDIVGVQTVGWP